MIIEKTKVFNEWFLNLKDRVLMIAIVKRLEKIENHDHFGDYKVIDGEICELRIHFGAGYRVYFAQKNSKIILLLCAGDKSTQQKDIKKARELI
ncbi:MAG: type II toxin-antitoxin system RelE/ParE family toxin [Rickettsiales bacterium]|nr:type II toxin-antitoxin system RelE/ParE family toxin [Rickettsiales bacterium]